LAVGFQEGPAMIQYTRVFYLIFGLFTIAGGIIGYVKGSKVSLVAGGLAGALLLLAFFLLPGYLNPALIIGLLVSVLLLGQFLPKLLHGELKPRIIALVVLSVASLVLTLVTWYKR
jgi:uncharacterized membrane protein (UPF0136 family)